MLKATFVELGKVEFTENEFVLFKKSDLEIFKFSVPRPSAKTKFIVSAFNISELSFTSYSSENISSFSTILKIFLDKSSKLLFPKILFK